MMSTTACVKTMDNTPTSSGTITGFSFEQSLNNIPVSSEGTINASDITIFLPPGTNVTGLKPSFNLSDDATVSIDGVSQQSGVTAVDFSEPVTYTVSVPGSTDVNYTVTLITDISEIDNNVVAFMQKYHVPGLAIAITKDDRLVYSKGYGFADTSSWYATTTSSLFRLASDSKQFTSVAVMRLLDKGKINMTDKIFGQGSILGTTYGTQPYNQGVTAITVSDLLHHTSGGWSTDGNEFNGYNDPVFSNLEMNNDQLISWTLDNVPLDTLPNTKFEYSNFGYFLLARVIEKITGQPYQQAVQDLVLTPCGIKDMAIAGNTLADRNANEVIYYNQEQQSPYGLNISRADGCAGWIASAEDLTRLMTHIDQLNPSTDIISTNTYNVMTSITPVSDGYACGWGVYPYNEGFEHQGSLPGTSSDQAFSTTLMSPNNSGNFSFGIVINTRSLDNNYGGDLDNIFWNATVKAWPSYDLFNTK